MMGEGLGLKEALGEMVRRRQAGASRVYNHPALTKALEQAVKELLIVHGGGKEREPRHADLQTTLKALEEHWATTRSLAGLPVQHAKKSPWVLFWDKCTTASDPQFIDAYGNEVLDALGARILVRLIHVWLRDYPKERPFFGRWRARIASSLTRRGDDSRPRMRQSASRAHGSYCLEEEGALKLGRLLVETTDRRDLLVNLGLAEGELGQGRYLAAACRHALDVVSERLRTRRFGPPDIEAFFKDVVLLNGIPRFEAQSHLVADALLLPFTDRSVPAEELKNTIMTRLLHLLGDPRLRPETWRQVHDGARNLILTWLAGEAIEAFLRVLDETAVDQHWRYRRAFWTAHFDEGHIQEAWVAFGQHASWLAERAEHIQKGRYGELYQGLAEHSVLLMKIGRVTIAEWSHNGCCWIWAPGDLSAPRLYKRGYGKHELTGPNTNYVRSDADHREHGRRPVTPVGFWHVGSENLRWQHRVRDEIRRLTGIAVPVRLFTHGG